MCWTGCTDNKKKWVHSEEKYLCGDNKQLQLLQLREQTCEHLRMRQITFVPGCKFLNLQTPSHMRWMVTKITITIKCDVALREEKNAITKQSKYLSLSRRFRLQILRAVCRTRELNVLSDTTMPSTSGVDNVILPVGPWSFTLSSPLLRACTKMT